MTATVVMHRPVYKRVDLAAKAQRAPEPGGDPNVCTAALAEHARIWALLKQCAQGTNGVVEA